MNSPSVSTSNVSSNASLAQFDVEEEEQNASPSDFGSCKVMQCSRSFLPITGAGFGIGTGVLAFSQTIPLVERAADIAGRTLAVCSGLYGCGLFLWSGRSIWKIMNAVQERRRALAEEREPPRIPTKMILMGGVQFLLSIGLYYTTSYLLNQYPPNNDAGSEK